MVTFFGINSSQDWSSMRSVKFPSVTSCSSSLSSAPYIRSGSLIEMPLRIDMALSAFFFFSLASSSILRSSSVSVYFFFLPIFSKVWYCSAVNPVLFTSTSELWWLAFVDPIILCRFRNFASASLSSFRSIS